MGNNFGFDQVDEPVQEAPKTLGLDALKKKPRIEVPPDKKGQLEASAEAAGFPHRPVASVAAGATTGKRVKREVPREPKRGICVHGDESIIDRFAVFTNQNKFSSYAVALKALMDKAGVD